MSSKRTFHKYEIRVVVLTEDPIPDDASLEEIAHQGVEGDYSIDWKIDHAPIDAPTTAKLLLKQRSDPEFFGLDENGNDADE